MAGFAVTTEAQQRALKGKLFEGVLGILLKSAKPFEAWNRIQTPTNELDWLITLGPSAQFVPAMRTWGAHIVAECKSEKSYVSVTWVEKLATLIDSHGTSVALLLSTKGLASKGNAKRAVNIVQLLSAQNKVIVCLNMDDIRGCANGGPNFLRLLSRQYTAARAGLARLRVLTT